MTLTDIFFDMLKNKEEDIELLLSKLDKAQLCEFIKEECASNKQFKQRFLALGAGSDAAKAAPTGAAFDR